MKKLIVFLIVFSLIFPYYFSEAQFPGFPGFPGIPLGDILGNRKDIFNQETFLPPSYQDDNYSIFNTSTHSWAENFQKILESAKPPKEGVPVFPYDPVLYTLLFLGFNLGAAGNLQNFQLMQKDILERVSNNIKKEARDSYFIYQILSSQKYFEKVEKWPSIYEEVGGLENEGLTVGKIASAYNLLVSNLSNLDCIDPLFRDEFEEQILAFSDHFYLRSYAENLLANIPDCEPLPLELFPLSYQNISPKNQGNLLSRIIGAFSPKFFLAQTQQDQNGTDQSLQFNTVVLDATQLDRTLRNIGHSSKAVHVLSSLSSAYSAPDSIGNPGTIYKIDTFLKLDNGYIIPI
ncbi:MAG: hypothetical protein C4348_02615, partial [Patescibacteria group bacterium]